MDNYQLRIQFNITDVSSLRNSYMPFIINGGLFIAGDNNYELGTKLHLTVNLINETTAYSSLVKIIWISPSGSSSIYPAGVGVQFIDLEQAQVLCSKITGYLAYTEVK